TGSLSTLFSGDGMEDVTIGSGSVIPDSSATSALPAGSYSFQASWPGDSNYNSATATCEPLTVNKGSPTLSTVIVPASPVALGSTVHDTASFSSLTSGFPATGTVTYKFYGTGTCTGSLSTLFSGDGMQDVTIGSGSVIPDSSATSALPAGSYSFQASWPGDSNYNSATSDCEPLTVNKASTATATAIHLDPGHTVVTSVALGSTVHDKATVTATSTPFPITGTVQFRFSTAGCGGTFSNFGGPVSLASGTAESASTAPLAAGSYAF